MWNVKRIINAGKIVKIWFFWICVFTFITKSCVITVGRLLRYSPFFKHLTPFPNHTIIHNIRSMHLTELPVNFCRTVSFCKKIWITAWNQQLNGVMALIINHSHVASNKNLTVKIIASCLKACFCHLVSNASYVKLKLT